MTHGTEITVARFGTLAEALSFARQLDFPTRIYEDDTPVSDLPGRHHWPWKTREI